MINATNMPQWGLEITTFDEKLILDKLHISMKKNYIILQL